MKQNPATVRPSLSMVAVEDLGLLDYDSAWKRQDEYAAQIAEGLRPPTLLLLEHPHVYTFGRRGQAGNLLWNETELQDKGARVRWVDRGGDVTYHGPGQLVGYPIFPLAPIRTSTGPHSTEETKIPRADYVGYIRKLEETLILTLARLGLAAGQRPGLTGVWIQPEVWSRCRRCRPEDRNKPAKIAAIGIKVDARGVSRHGFALNVEPDMSYWDGIVACGLAEEPVASLADLLVPVPEMEVVKGHVVRAFRETFEVELAPGTD